MSEEKRIISNDELDAKLDASPAARVTTASIAEKVAKTEFLNNGLLTICVLTMQNGFTVVGTSACASPENYDQEIGEKVAYDKAVDQIWALEGYLLKERLYQESLQAGAAEPEQEEEQPAEEEAAA